MKRGQAAIEFIFLILIVIVYLTTVTIPLVKSAQGTITDTELIARANNETQKIVNSINEVSIQGEGSKQTINLFVPDNATINCDADKISFTANLTQQPYPAQCPAGICIKEFLVGNTTLDCALQSIKGPEKTKVIIEKGASNVTLAQGS